MNIKCLLKLYVDNLKKIYRNNLLKVSLFGSYARGENNVDSDIDILVIVQGSQKEVSSYNRELYHMTFEFNLNHDVDIQVVDMCSEYYYRWCKGDRFLLNVADDEVRLYEAA